MINFAIDINAVLSELSRMCGSRVRLRSARTDQGRVAHMVCPMDSSQLRQPLWTAVMQSTKQGVWDTPEQAVVGFAFHLAAWMAQSRVPANRIADMFLQDALAAGSLPARSLITKAADAGISRDRLDRAARRVGVVRRKDGMSGGWLWELPAGAPARQTPPAELLEGRV